MGNIREWLNRNPAIAGMIAVAVVVVAVIVVTLSSRGPTPLYGALSYYYDLNTATLLVDRAGRETPFETESGPTADGDPAGVRAIVFSCGDCHEEDERFPAYLRKSGPEGQTLIRRPDDARWRSANPEVEAAWREEVAERCRQAGGSARQCLPRSR